MKKYEIKRRTFLHYGAVGAATVMAWPFISGCNSNTANSKDQNDDDKAQKNASNNFKPDLDFELTAVERDMAIFSGSLTRVWVFESKLKTWG